MKILVYKTLGVLAFGALFAFIVLAIWTDRHWEFVATSVLMLVVFALFSIAHDEAVERRDRKERFEHSVIEYGGPR